MMGLGEEFFGIIEHIETLGMKVMTPETKAKIAVISQEIDHVNTTMRIEYCKFDNSVDIFIEAYVMDLYGDKIKKVLGPADEYHITVSEDGKLLLNIRIHNACVVIGGK